MSTLKEVLVWINEFTSPVAFLEALGCWVGGYNANYLHSTLGYTSPEALEPEQLSRETRLAGSC